MSIEQGSTVSVPDSLSLDFQKEEKVNGVYHKVKKGETVYRIAKTYNVPINDIIRKNSIPNVAKLEINQLIFIPGATHAMQTYYLEEEKNPDEFAWPLKGKISSFYRDRNGSMVNQGLDILVPEGTFVKASRTGKVVFADSLSGYGETLILDHLDGFYSVYSHNGKLLVRLGESIRKGTQIALVGERANQAFLHFQIRKHAMADNPLYYLP